MIGNVTRGGNFYGLARYLTEDRSRVAWMDQRNLLDHVEPKALAGMMDATARQSRASKPVYHLSVAIAPEEGLSESQWLEVADRLLDALDLSEHQALIVAHNDQRHDHIHIAVSRVHPTRLRAAPLRHDYRTIERVCREIEREWNLREVPGRNWPIPPEVEHSARVARLHEMRVAVQRHVDSACSWTEFADGLRQEGILFEPRGRGMTFTDGQVQFKASEVSRRASRQMLEARWGKLRSWIREVNRIAWLLDRYAERDERWSAYAEEAQRHRQTIKRGRAYDRGIARAQDEYREALELFYVDPARAEEELASAAKKGPYEITLWVMQRPEVYGEVVNFDHPGTRTYYQHELVRAHFKVEKLRRDRASHQPELDRATERMQTLGAQLDRARQRDRNLRQLQRIGKRISRLGSRKLLNLFGWSPLTSFLTPPGCQIPLRVARKALRLAKGLGRNLGR